MAMRSQTEFAKTAIEKRCAFRNALRMELDEIRKALEKSGKTQRGLARLLGVEDSAVTRILKGERQIKASEMEIIRDYLQLPDVRRERSEALPIRETRPLIAPHEFISYPKDVPIMGVTVGGSEGDFLINMGEPADFARRTPAIAGAKHVFALYVQGTSMSRWRDHGSLVYVDRLRPPKAGDRVVVELHPEKEGDGHPAYLKELVSKTSAKLRLRQYNPEQSLEIALTKIVHVHRVIEWEELLSL